MSSNIQAKRVLGPNPTRKRAGVRVDSTFSGPGPMHNLLMPYLARDTEFLRYREAYHAFRRGCVVSPKDIIRARHCDTSSQGGARQGRKVCELTLPPLLDSEWYKPISKEWEDFSTGISLWGKKISSTKK